MDMDFTAVNAALAKRSVEEEEARKARARMLVGDTTPPRINLAGEVNPSMAPNPLAMAAPSAAPAPVQSVVPPLSMMRKGPIAIPVTETSSTTQSVARTPEMMSAVSQMGAAGAAQKQAVQALGQGASAAAAKEALTQEEIGNKELELAGQEKAERDAMNTKRQDRLAAYQNDLQKFQNEEYQGFWQTRGTGEKIAAALAITMGAVGAALQGRAGNVALDIIQKAIDDDYTQYENRILKQLKGLEQSRIAEEDKAELEEKAILSAAAYRSAQLGQVKNKLLVQSAQAKSEEAKNNAALMAAQIDAQLAEANMRVSEMLAPRTSTTSQTKQVVVDGAGGPGGGKWFENQDKMKEALDKDDAVKKARQVRSAGNALLNIKGNDTTSDAARIQTFVKTGDPTSTTSIAEMKGSLANAGLAGIVDESLNFITGRVMTPAQRESLKRITLDRMEAASRDAMPVYDYYSRIAQERGYTPQDVIPDFDFYKRFKAQESPTAPQTLEQKRSRLQQLEALEGVR